MSARLEVLQTYASGPAQRGQLIIWPNPEVDNDITVRPEVKSLVQRYLDQMLAGAGREARPGPADRPCWRRSADRAPPGNRR